MRKEEYKENGRKFTSTRCEDKCPTEGGLFDGSALGVESQGGIKIC